MVWHHAQIPTGKAVGNQRGARTKSTPNSTRFVMLHSLSAPKSTTSTPSTCTCRAYSTSMLGWHVSGSCGALQVTTTSFTWVPSLFLQIQ